MNPIIDKTSLTTGLSSPETEKRSRWLFWGAMGVFVIATALIGVWVMSHDTVDKMTTLQDQLAAAKPYLLIWRLGLVSFLIGCYPVWVNKVADFLHFHPLQRQIALHQRWRMASLIILVEVLFPQRGPALVLLWLFPGL